MARHRYCAHKNAVPRTLNYGKRVAVMACGDCGRRVDRAVVACPDCNHLPFTQRSDCETCPAEIRGWVLAAEPEPVDCCYRPAVRRGEEQPCANCARMMAANSRHLIHGCEYTTPEEDERADDMAAAPRMEQAAPMSKRAREFADTMGW